MKRQYTDKEILESIQSNFELDVLSFLFHRIYERIVAHVVNNSGKKEQAFEVLQEALVFLYRKIKLNQYDPTYDIDGFLLATCRKIWINRAKLNRGHYLYSSSELDQEAKRFFFLLDPSAEKHILSINSSIPEQDHELLLDVCFHKKDVAKLLVKYQLNMAEDLNQKVEEIKTVIGSKIQAQGMHVPNPSKLVNQYILNAGLLFIRYQVESVVNHRSDLNLSNKTLWGILGGILGLGAIIALIMLWSEQSKNMVNEIGPIQEDHEEIHQEIFVKESIEIDSIARDSAAADSNIVEEVIEFCDTIKIQADIIIQPSCSNKNDGSIKFTNIKSNGKPPYWTSIDNGMSFSLQTTYKGVGTGKYRLMVQEGNECFGRVGTKTVPSADCPEILKPVTTDSIVVSSDSNSLD